MSHHKDKVIGFLFTSVVFLTSIHATPSLIYKIQYYCMQRVAQHLFEQLKTIPFPAGRCPSLFCGHVSKVLTTIDSFSQTDSLAGLEI